MDNGVRVSINCDNRTISNTDLNREFCLLKEYFGFEKEEFRKIYLNCVEAAFASESVKGKLKGFVNEFE